MYNLYLEEEGFRPSYKHYVLGGCIVNTEYIPYINDEITQKKNYLYSTPLINLKDLANPNKKILVYENRNIQHFDNFKLMEIFDDIPEVLEKTEIYFISSIVDKKVWNSKNEYPNDFYYMAYKSIIERFDNFLSDKESQGNIFMDYENLHLKVNMETAHDVYVNEFKEFKLINNLVDSMHFNFGYNSNLSQLAYIFTKAVYSLFEKNFDGCFIDFLPFIYNKYGKIFNFGIQYFPENCIKNISEEILNRIEKIEPPIE